MFSLYCVQRTHFKQILCFCLRYGVLHVCNLFVYFRILPNLRHTVYCCAVATGGVQEWDFVWQMFKNATDDARHLHYALSCTKDPQLLKRCVCVCVCVFCSATKSKQTKGGRSGKFVYDNVGNITNAKG